MLPNDTPYPFDNMAYENYFGEFRELSNSIGQYEKKDKENAHPNTDNRNPDDVFNEFSIFPKY
jgi:hypothetical protein